MLQQKVASSKYLFSYVGAIYWLGQKTLVGIDLINLNNSDNKFSRDFRMSLGNLLLLFLFWAALTVHIRCSLLMMRLPPTLINWIFYARTLTPSMRYLDDGFSVSSLRHICDVCLNCA